MYNIQGVKISCDQFWELIKISNDLVTFEEKLDELEGRKKENKLVKELLMESKTTKQCDNCNGKMIPASSRFGKYLKCSNFPNCLNIAKIS